MTIEREFIIIVKADNVNSEHTIICDLIKEGAIKLKVINVSLMTQEAVYHLKSNRLAMCAAKKVFDQNLKTTDVTLFEYVSW